MNIILEGPDASGKTTLAKRILEDRFPFGWSGLRSDGPTKTQEHFDRRAYNFLTRDRCVFDRHCIISEQIYGKVRGNVMVKDHHLKLFNRQPKVIIYCRGGNLDSHNVKEHDTPDHVAMISAHQALICELYDRWALANAHIVYRIGDEYSIIRNLLARIV